MNRKSLALFHGTDRDFDVFDPQFFGSIPERCANGCLGVWVAIEPDLAGRFGKRILEVHVVDAQCYALNISDLMKLHIRAMNSPDEVEFYRDQRAKLLANDIDVVEIVETDGSVQMAIVVNIESINNIEAPTIKPSPVLN